ncbi:T9SS type A sorting domain-containing protein [Taibaiella helva]|uniref:T9SS type A sorting domain-containing protein n=1 Tax=Taibaiella helva TaxID=2301235 RepID=UPI0013008E2E|nr:T9SS type A sorting domain-containing protein [Taibaiella helva]
MNRLDSLFPFTEANFWGSYKRLQIAPQFYYDTALNNNYNWYYDSLGFGLGQTDPIINLDYSLDGFARTTSALYTPGTNTATSCETAFFIFPGSGTNCTNQVATGTGYHSLFCDTKNNLKQYGDVFTYCKPNEDWRAILWNDRKLATEIGSAYLLNYLDGTGHKLGVNANIEFLAFLKLLKSKYKKVVVLALSHGGLNTIMSLSEVDVDGYLISGGYTAATYLVQSQIFLQQKYFGNTYNLHPPSVTKNNIIHANSEFLFAWSQADGQVENSNHYTENYFGPLPNVAYFYAFPLHSFPYCSVIDSFVQRVQRKPKPFIEALDTGCTTDSMIARITFCGQPPFSFDVYRNSTLYNSYTSNTDTFDITLTQEGSYSVSNLYDATAVPGYRSDTLLYVKDSAVNFEVTSRYFNCDSNNTQLRIQLSGTSPWIVNYNYNGSLYNDTIHTNTRQYALQNGNITFLNVTDSNTCHKVLTQTFDIADSLVAIDSLQPQYSCDSNKMQIHVAVEGRAPWTISYKKNGIAAQVVLNTSDTNLYFDNGLYEFIDVTDSNSCHKAIGQVFNFNESPISYAFQSRYFDCSISKTRLNFQLGGRAPWVLHYSKNGVSDSAILPASPATLTVDNGDYHFYDVRDSNNCVQVINEDYGVQDSLPQFQILAQAYSCDSNRTEMMIQLSGRAPWVLYYNKNGNSDSFMLSASLDTLYLNNGNYSFYQLKDSNNCTINLSQQFILNEPLVGYTFLSRSFDCSSSMTRLNFQLEGKAPWVLHYSKNGISDSATFLASPATLTVDNGEYHFYAVRDSNSCIQAINETYSVHDSLPQFQITGNGFLCLLGQTQLNYALAGRAPWTLSYLSGSTPVTVNTNSVNNSLYLLNGTYTFLSIADSNGCVQPINQTLTIDENLPSLVSTQIQFDCSRDSFLLKVQLIGDSPYTFYYTRNGTPDSFLFGHNYDSVYVSRGNYHLSSFSDNNHCAYIVDTNLILTDSLPGLSVLASGFSCSKDSNYVALKFAGTPGWQIQYTLDGTSYTFFTSEETDTLWSGNGTLQLQQLTDFNGCAVALSDIFLFKSYLPRAQLLASGYDCVQQKGYCVFGSSGNLPIKLYYTYGGQLLSTPLGSNSTDTLGTDTLWLDNGVYEFNEVTDLNGCAFAINSTVTIDYAPLTFSYEVTAYNCASNLGTVALKIPTGNPPYEIKVTNNNVDDVLQTTTGIIYHQFAPGSFQVHSVTDMTGCTIYPDVELNVVNDSLKDPLGIYLDGLHVKTDNTGTNYIWYYDNVPVDTTEAPVTDFIGNGMYHVGVTNTNGCIYYTRSVLLNKGKFVAYPNPAKEEVNILIGLPKGETADVDLLDATGRHIKTITVKNGIHVMSLRELDNGIYILRVNYKGIGYNFENIRLVKR